MKTFNIEFTQNEVYFLYNYIGGISSVDAKEIIREELCQISEEPYKETIKNLIDLVNKSIPQSIFTKIEKCNVKSPSKLVKKYKVVFHDRDCDYQVASGYYTSQVDFESNNDNCTFISLIGKTMIEVEE